MLDAFDCNRCPIGPASVRFGGFGNILRIAARIGLLAILVWLPVAELSAAQVAPMTVIIDLVPASESDRAALNSLEPDDRAELIQESLRASLDGNPVGDFVVEPISPPFSAWVVIDIASISGSELKALRRSLRSLERRTARDEGSLAIAIVHPGGWELTDAANLLRSAERASKNADETSSPSPTGEDAIPPEPSETDGVAKEEDFRLIDAIGSVVEGATEHGVHVSVTLVMRDLAAVDHHPGCLKPAALERFVDLISNRGVAWTLLNYGQKPGFFGQVADWTGGNVRSAAETRLEEVSTSSNGEVWRLRINPSGLSARPVALDVASALPEISFRAPRYVWPRPQNVRPPSGADLLRASEARRRRDFLLKARQEIESLAAARKVVEASPFTLDDRLRVVQLLEGLDFDYSDQIISSLSPLRDLFPRAWRIPFHLGRAWARKQMSEEAVAEYLQALDLGGSRPEIHLPLARLYRSLGQMEEAIDHYGRLSGTAKDVSATRFERAELLFGLGRLEPAEEHVLKAVEMDSANLAARELLVKTRLRREDAQGVVAAADALLELDSGNSVAEYGAGLGLAWSQRFAQALPYLERSVDRSPADFALQYQLYRTQRALGRIDRALESLKAATALKPGDPELYLLQAELHREKGDFWAVGRALEEGVEINRNDGGHFELLFEFGKWLARRGDHSRAADAFRRAANSKTDDGLAAAEALQRAAVEVLLEGRPAAEGAALFGAAGLAVPGEFDLTSNPHADIQSKDLQSLPLPGGLEALFYFAPFLQERRREGADLLCLLLQFILEPEGPNSLNQRRLELISFYEEYSEFTAWLKRKRLFAAELSLKITSDPQDVRRANAVLSYFGAKLKIDRKSPGGLSVKIDNKQEHRRRRVVLKLMGLNLALLRPGTDFEFRFSQGELPLVLGLDFWLRVLGRRPPPDLILAEILNDVELMRLYVAFARLPAAARTFLARSFEPSELVGDLLPGLWVFGAMLKYQPDGALWLPGGPGARSLWARLADRSPDDSARFTKRIFKKDDGKALYYLASLSQAPPAAADYILASAERFKRFYGKLSGFGKTMSNGAPQRKYHDFADLLWLLDFDGEEVYFPGSAEMWGVASHGDDEKLSKLDRKLSNRRRVAADKLISSLIDQEQSGQALQGVRNYAVLMHLDDQTTGLITPRTGLAFQWSFPRFGGHFGIFADLQTDPDLGLKLLRAAEILEETVSDKNRRTALALFQGPLALLQALARSGGLGIDDARQLADDFLSRRYPSGPPGRQAQLVSRFLSASLLPRIGPTEAANAGPDRLVAALASRANVEFDWKGREVHARLKAAEERRLQGFLDLQNLSPLSALLQAFSALERVAEERESAFDELAQACKRMREPDARDWTDQYREALVHTRLHKLRERLSKLNQELGKKKPKNLNHISADIADELAPFLADTLLGLIYASNTHEEDLVSRIDENFVRKHSFEKMATLFAPGGPQPFGGSWGQATVSYDPVLGSHLKGGLIGIKAALTQLRAEQHSGGLTHRIAEPVFAVHQKLAVDLVNSDLLDDSTLTRAASLMQLGRQLLAAAVVDPVIRQHALDFAFDACGSARSESFRLLLESGEVKRAERLMLPSELLFLARSWLQMGQRSDRLGWFFQSSSPSHPLEAELPSAQLDQLGFPVLSWYGLNSLSLGLRMSPEAGTAYVSPHRLAERMAELKLRLAEIFWRNGLPASIFRPVANRLADEVIAQTAQASAQDWPALWEATQKVVDEDKVTEAVDELIRTWGNEGS